MYAPCIMREINTYIHIIPIYDPDCLWKYIVTCKIRIGLLHHPARSCIHLGVHCPF